MSDIVSDIVLGNRCSKCLILAEQIWELDLESHEAACDQTRGDRFAEAVATLRLHHLDRYIRRHMVEPITPEEINAKKAEIFPDAVIEAFNELIVEKWNGQEASFNQDAAVDLILEKIKRYIDAARDDSGHVYLPASVGRIRLKYDDVVNFHRQMIFNKHWLNVENVYRLKGWLVTYDSPSFNEDAYPATFTFAKKR